MSLPQVPFDPGAHGRGHYSFLETPGSSHPDALAPSRARIQTQLQKFPQSKGEAWIPALEGILNETHPEIFFSELALIAQDLMDHQAGDLAAPLLQEIVEFSQDEVLRSKSQNKIHLLMGQGDLGQRMEQGIQALPQQILDGPTLAGMLVGGVAYRLGRGVLLRQLIPAGAPTPLTYSLGARSLASLGGLCLEAPLFVGITHSLQPELPFEARQSLAHTALTLGSLRSFGFAFQSLGGLIKGAPGSTRLWTSLMGNLGMMTGIAGAEAAARSFELAPPGEPLPLGLQTLITFAQFKGAGALYHRLAPSRLLQWEQRQDLKVQLPQLERALTNPLQKLNTLEHGLILASAGMRETPLIPVKASLNELSSQPMLSKATSGLEAQQGPLYSYRARSFLVQLPPVIRRLVIDMDYKLVDSEKGHHLGFLEILAAGAPKFIPDSRARLDYHIPLQRLHWMVTHSEYGSRKGTYFTWLSKNWLERALAKQDVAGVHEFLRRLGRGGKLSDLERFFANHLETFEIPPYEDHIAKNRYSSISSHDHLLRGSPFDHYTLNILHGLGIYVDQWPQGTDPLDFSYRGLLFGISYHLSRVPKDQAPLIESIIRQLPEQALPKWRLLRLYQLTYFNHRDPFIHSKLAELADPHLQIEGDSYQARAIDPKQVLNSQWDAYMGEQGPFKMISVLLNEAKESLGHAVATKNREQRRRSLEEFISHHPKDPTQYSLVDWAQAFHRLGDGVSKRVARLLTSGALRLEVLKEKDYLERKYILDELSLKRLPPGVEAPQRIHSPRPTQESPRPQQAANNNNDIIRDKHISEGDMSVTPPIKESSSLARYFNKRLVGDTPVLLIRYTPETQSSLRSRADNLFELMKAMVHECRHFIDLSGQEFVKAPIDIARSEMNAHTLDALWAARHGDPLKLQNYLMFGPMGPGLHLRERLEFQNLLL